MRPIDADEIQWYCPTKGFSSYALEEEIDNMKTLEVIPKSMVEEIKTEISHYMNAYKTLIDNKAPVRESMESLQNRVNTYEQCIEIINKYLAKVTTDETKHSTFEFYITEGESKC